MDVLPVWLVDVVPEVVPVVVPVVVPDVVLEVLLIDPADPGVYVLVEGEVVPVF